MNHFQICPKMDGYQISRGFCVSPYNQPPVDISPIQKIRETWLNVFRVVEELVREIRFTFLNLIITIFFMITAWSEVNSANLIIINQRIITSNVILAQIMKFNYFLA